MRIMVTTGEGQASRDLLLECDDATPPADLLASLAGHADAVSEQALAALDREAEGIGGLGLRHGACLGAAGGATTDLLADPGSLQLHVVGGPDAGTVYRLTRGSHELGRTAALSWGDHSLSRRHCRLDVADDGVRVVDLGSSNGTRIDAEEVDGEEGRAWEPGELLEIGDSLVQLRRGRSGDVATTGVSEPGWLDFVRPPRITPSYAVPSVTLPRPPTEKRNRRFPWIMIAVPMLFGITMATVLGNPLYLMFGLMSPVMLLGNYFSDKRGNAKDAKTEKREYDEALAAAQEKLDTAVTEEERRLREQLADPAALLATCLLPGRRLWERRPDDDDFLRLRVGSTDQGASVLIDGEKLEERPQVHAVPVGVDLRETGVVGIAGPPASVDALLRWHLGQLAACHAPRDLQLVVLLADADEEWNHVRWLPQLRYGTDGVGVGNDDATREERVAALADLVTERRAEAGESSRRDPVSYGPIVVVVHGYSAMRSLKGLSTVLTQGPAVGVFALCTDEAERDLPERCTATVVVEAANPSLGTLTRRGKPTVERLLLDGVDARWAERVARALAPLKDVSGDGDAGALPSSARLLEVVELDPPTGSAIARRWARQPLSTEMVVGVGPDGPFSLDLAGDGPHGLVAGMTGSGKTELLQTMIASLALANRPDGINFVLVDYKGDSAFKDCVDLPHTVGKVSDLDAHLVERALASLQAELKHREHFLAEAGVKDIGDYQDLREREPDRAPLPRLLLVIDEFAQLVKDLPDFVSGLVDIAQLGRSLGIHLILATQRPSGVVSPEIRANTNMRIALRVADTADSADVIGTGDSATIRKSSPGRAYARLGAASLVPFQSGRVGGRRPGARTDDLAPPFLRDVPWHEVAYQWPSAPTATSEESAVSDTDLAALVTAVREAAEQIDSPPQRRPWLEALPARLLWEDQVPQGEGADGAVRGRIPALPLGRADLPSAQRQDTYAFDMVRDGHLFVVGSARTGRSQVLRTLAAAVGRLCDPSDVHLYGLDCGSGVLNPLMDLPHCGAVVGRTEAERVGRLFGRLLEELDRRQRLLAGAGYADVAEQRRRDDAPLPHLVLLLDRWEGFMPTLGEVESNYQAVMRLLREGASAGVHLVITGDRTLATNSRIFSLCENRLALKLADRSDYGLVGLSPRGMPDDMAPGRAFTGTGTEVQVLTLASDDSGQAQGAVIREIAAACMPRSEVEVPPFRLDALPSMLTRAKAEELPDEQPVSGPAALLGVGGDELTRRWMTLTGGRTFIVAGPGGSGRSSVLHTMACSALERGATVLVLAPRPSPLRELEGTEGVLAVARDGLMSEAEMRELVAGATGQVLIVVDDGEGLRDCAAAPFLLEVAKGQVEGVNLVLGGHSDGVVAGLSGWQVETRKGRTGILLSPQSISDGELIGVRLPRNVIGGPVRPGVGWLHRDGRLTQVATIYRGD